MIDLAIAFFTYVTEIVGWVYRLVGAFWTALLGALSLYFLGFMDFVIYLVCDLLVGLLDGARELVVVYDLSIPNPGDEFVFAAEVLVIANYYFPLDLGAVLVGSYVGFKFTIITVRHIIKITPFIG